MKTIPIHILCSIGYIFIFIMLSVNFFCNISSYDILAYITKNYIALICERIFVPNNICSKRKKIIE